jgi:hypothetical protein
MNQDQRGDNHVDNVSVMRSGYGRAAYLCAVMYEQTILFGLV